LIFLKGLIIGISIAAPVGPIGVLCIQRTITYGKLNGLATGLGAASTDAVYGFVAAFGLTFISNFLVAQQTWFRIIGGGFLLYLGIRAYFSTPENAMPNTSNQNHAGAYGTTFLLTLSNPMTILSFAAIFSGFGLVDSSMHYGSAALMIIGVFLGSASWWLLLSSGTNLFRNKLNERLSWINRLSGIVIAAFGVVAIVSLLIPVP
jgi:threonine/homoserine/homoserine lactone efflux protein